MPLNGKSRVQGKSVSGLFFRSLVFCALLFLVAAAVLYFFRSQHTTDRTQLVTKGKPPVARQARDEAFRTLRREKTPGTELGSGAVPKVRLKMDHRQPLTPGEDYMAPRWSRDGLDILVSKGKYTGLYIVSHDGSDIRRISDEPGVGYNAHWSPDGNYIVVEDEEGDRFYDRDGREVDAAPDQKRIGPTVYSKDGIVYRREGMGRSEADEVVVADEDQYFESVISPDKTKIAYIGLESGIVIKDLKNGEDVFIGQGTDICWLPDSSGIVFNYTQDDGKRFIDGDLYFAYADGRTVENITNTPEDIERHPDLSSDGSRLTYEVDGRIYSVEVEIH